MPDLTDRIERIVERALRRFRLGFYRARVTTPNAGNKRQHVATDWNPDAMTTRQVSSSLLDVTPKVGTRVAVMSQDGVVSFGATIGKIWDGSATPEEMKSWLRQNEQTFPGVVEMGSVEKVRCKVGDNIVEITPDGISIGDTHVSLQHGDMIVEALQIQFKCIHMFINDRPVNATGGPI
jgi:hypothetical protein